MVGPVSFITLPFSGTAKQTGRLATALTEAGIRVASVQVGSGVLIRSNDIGKARSVRDFFVESELASEGSTNGGEVNNATVARDMDPISLEPFQRPPDAVVEMPGSKSHSNRALLCAALASGQSTLFGALLADDTWAMIKPLRKLGLSVDVDEVTKKITCGGGLASPTSRASAMSREVELNVNQSGTTSRFLLPVLAGIAGQFILDGDPQLRDRPFRPQIDVLRSMGADIDGERLPLRIGGKTLGGRQITIDASLSSQFLSGMLIAAPMYEGETTIERTGRLVSRPYIELTLSTMSGFGVDVETDTEFSRFRVGHQRYEGAKCQIEPDASAASYFFAAAAVTGGRVRVEGLSSSSIQGDVGFVNVLEQMGAAVRRGDNYIEVAGTSTLEGVSVDMSHISDTAQTLAVVATFASTPTKITGIGFIRAKETDRIAAVVAELNRRGITATEQSDGLTVEPGAPNSGVVETYDDHRMAMSFALLGLVHPGIQIANPACVSKTFPDFFSVLESLRS